MGLQIRPEIVDVIKGVPVMVTLHGNMGVTLNKEQSIAQLIPVPPPAVEHETFSLPSQVSLVQKHIWTEKPTREYKVQGKRIKGLLDTGADLSVICPEDWDSTWHLATAPAVTGVGGTIPSQQSAVSLKVTTLNDQFVGFIQPVCVALDVSLWGRDLLQQLNATLVLDE